jgi:hypothetical protein
LGKGSVEVNEQEWLESGIVRRVWCWKLASARKFRLFLLACCRECWPMITDFRSRAAIAIAERFADQLASAEELTSARAAIRFRDRSSAGYLAYCVSDVSMHAETLGWVHDLDERPSGSAIRLAREIAALQYRNEFKDKPTALAEKKQTELARDILGNPFRPITIDPRWLSSNVVDLAHAIYHETAFGRMPILADALMDAGCDNEAVLNHCRNEGVHVRGCWVVDLLLGKS